MKNILDALLAVMGLLIPRLKKEDSVSGIKETKEALVALNEVSVFCAYQFKNGVQAADFSALYSEIIANPDFKAKMLAAYENYNLIPVEIKDLDLGEGLELAKLQVEYVEQFIEAFQKA